MGRNAIIDFETLAKIINTLNNVETRGKENLDRLLGCIITLEQIAAQSVKEVPNGGKTDK